MGQNISKRGDKDIPDSLLVSNSAMPWPETDVKKAILQKRLAPFYPPMPEEYDDDAHLYPCNICFFTYQGPLNRCENCGNFICTTCFCNIMPFDEWKGRMRDKHAKCPYCKISKWKVRISPRTLFEVEQILNEQKRVKDLQCQVRKREIEEETKQYNERIANGEIEKLKLEREKKDREKKEKVRKEKKSKHVKKNNDSIVILNPELERSLPLSFRRYIPDSILNDVSDITLIEERMMELAFMESLRESTLHTTVSTIQQFNFINPTLIVSSPSSTSGQQSQGIRRDLNGSLQLSLSGTSDVTISHSNSSSFDLTFQERSFSSDPGSISGDLLNYLPNEGMELRESSNVEVQLSLALSVNLSPTTNRNPNPEQHSENLFENNSNINTNTELIKDNSEISADINVESNEFIIDLD